jgi:hypothetical protein
MGVNLTREDRERLAQDYLRESGRNSYNAREFVHWLRERPDHPAYPWVFDKSVKDAAEAYYIAQARRFVSDLRLVVRAKSEAKEVKVLGFRTVTAPAFISPYQGRANGGGYHRFDPNDRTHVAEVQREAYRTLDGLLRRAEIAFTEKQAAQIGRIARDLERQVAEVKAKTEAARQKRAGR